MKNICMKLENVSINDDKISATIRNCSYVSGAI